MFILVLLIFEKEGGFSSSYMVLQGIDNFFYALSLCYPLALPKFYVELRFVFFMLKLSKSILFFFYYPGNVTLLT